MALDFSKITIHEFWCNNREKEHGHNVILCLITIDSLMVYIKAKNVSEYLTEQVKKRLDTSNDGMEITLSIRKKKIN